MSITKFFEIDKNLLKLDETALEKCRGQFENIEKTAKKDETEFKTVDDLLKLAEIREKSLKNISNITSEYLIPEVIFNMIK